MEIKVGGHYKFISFYAGKIPRSLTQGYVTVTALSAKLVTYESSTEDNYPRKCPIEIFQLCAREWKVE